MTQVITVVRFLRLSMAGSQEKQKIVNALLGNVSKDTQAK